ncbi:hypothetical protein HYS91_02335 [Candidatus Daviesbacteria bacterium]|nr:hypothetical protein [Candidatus Daviesbacteria bacterium]
MKKIDKRIGTIAAVYFIIGLIFAILFALFYHWTLLSYFSPGFYMVILTWPIQLIGFVPDFLQYGFSGKPI